MSPPAQQIRFCTSRDGTRIAYATCGSGPPLVRAANWLSHLDLDWDSPVWRHWLTLLARRHTLIRYDHRGCGLSDRDGVEFSIDKFVEDFEAVVETARLDRFVAFGLAGGASTAVAYAATHPERVNHLVLVGSNVQGRGVRATTAELREETDAQLKAITIGWLNDNPAYRQFFTSIAIPDGTADHFRSFNDQKLRTLSPQNAAQIMRTYWSADLRRSAPKVRCPTLVLHSRDDARIPFEQGRALATLIPNARFVALESRNHLLLENEPAWSKFVEAFEDFVPTASAGEPAPSLDDLSSREREVLDLVAQGLDNNRISSLLKISEKTIRNHVSAIFSKLGINSRAQAVAVARDAGLGRRTLS